MRYTGKKTAEISFPIGGIGSGCIGLAGNGNIKDFEIFNRPNKNSYNTYTSIVIKAEDEENVIDVRALMGDYEKSYMGDSNRIGGGVDRRAMTGMPHFKKSTFIGEFPFAKIKFSDEKFPGAVSLEAYNPFIPLNDKDSSLPVAIFGAEIKNTTDRTLTYTVCFNLSNPYNGYGKHSVIKREDYAGIFVENMTYTENMPEYGNMCLLTDGDDISYQQYWWRKGWYEGLEMFWTEFGEPGKLKNRDYTELSKGDTDTASLAVSVKVMPNERKKINFVLSWYYPNCINYWKPEEENKIWKNYYATLFSNSEEAGKYVLENLKRLYKETKTFKNALWSSTLPPAVADAVCNNISILKSPTCLRLEDGSFYGFEGCGTQSGSCEGSCSHVWNYQYALPFLFPQLERSMRELDFKYNMNENGGMIFRLQLPLGREQWKFRPAADGHLGGIIKTYREWKICGDDEWLKRMWKNLKINMEYVWSEKNPDFWDPGKTGVLHGRQHHTLDRELFGENSWLTGFYLCALKAMAEMAKYLGEEHEEYTKLYKQGKKWVEENLFNGEYFYQNINLSDLSQLDKYSECDRYYNYDTGEVNFQIGEGCCIDQVIGQWHAILNGLGEIYDEEKVVSALKSIYKYNFKKNLRDIFNPCRMFALNDEAGTLICEWPKGKYCPKAPVPYSRELMTGFEYQVASHMIAAGMEKEGLELVCAIRRRYDGEKRNPWNEFECGSNYSRAMASYALLLIYSGFEFNMQRNEIGFKPKEKGDCRYFWSVGSAWGIYEKKGTKAVVKVLYGELKLKTLKLNEEISEVSTKAKSVVSDGSIVFEDVIILSKNESISATIKQ